jgi:hypothetical protein
MEDGMIKLTIRRNDRDWVVKEFETDKELFDFMVNDHSELIPPEVYETLERGYHTYGDLSDEEKETIYEETGQDEWDGESLVRWIGQGGEVDIFTQTC